MKRVPLVVLVATVVIQGIVAQNALFINDEIQKRGKRAPRQSNADQMVQNILQWLQGVYTQNSRRIRQGTLREYLPPSNTQKPRPFEPFNPDVVQPPFKPGTEDTDQGYPPSGITPQPPFPIYTNPATGAVTGEGYPSPTTGITGPGGVPPFDGYPTSQTPRPPFSEGPGTPSPTGYPTGPTGPTGTGYPTTGYPTRPGFPSERPPAPTGYPTGYPSGRPTGYPTKRPGYPTQPPTTYPTQPSTYPTQPTGYPTQPPTSYPTQPPSTYPTQRPTGYPTQPPTGYPTQQPTRYPTQPPTTYPTQPPVTEVTYPAQTNPPITSRPAPEVTTPPADNQITDSGANGGLRPTPPTDEDLKHPPHIHDIKVQCAKDMMTINIEFNRQFDGVIYSKGYYNNPECRYVKENSGQTKYSFTVSLNSCGTEFINAFDTQGQSYLENILVLQNEPGIQEVWDTIRSVRCLWEGNLKESLSVALSVGMLSQEIVTFSGDTAMAKLDIQLGKGPFAPPANGLVKIGEPMTLVVSVTGDPGFDIQVRDCRAKDSTGENVVQLTDDSGCILKPKLFGAFQKTRNTGNTGASIIAYAFFNAFKFPDVMDLMLECNIELCKTDCEMCPQENQPIEPGRRRRRRDLYYHNETIASDGVLMGKHLRVILPEDLSDSKTVVNFSQMEGVCMSTQNFIFSSVLLISLLTISSLFSAYLWLKNQSRRLKQ